MHDCVKQKHAVPVVVGTAAAWNRIWNFHIVSNTNQAGALRLGRTRGNRLCRAKPAFGPFGLNQREQVLLAILWLIYCSFWSSLPWAPMSKRPCRLPTSSITNLYEILGNAQNTTSKYGDSVPRYPSRVLPVPGSVSCVQLEAVFMSSTPRHSTRKKKKHVSQQCIRHLQSCLE
ncbi:hypothetical protein F5B21DRAFT_90741 [Xylaria acuta]|nr:hypothetical protein F5B21DRAFT_90741 [Xylaria acuta]